MSNTPVSDPSERPWYTKKRHIAWMALVGLIVLILLIGDPPADPDTTDASASAAGQEPATVTEVVTEQVTVDASADREAELDEREATLDAREAELDERKERLGVRKARLDEREEQLAGAEHEAAANTFTDGIYVVGSDIEPGTYATDGEGRTNPAGCYAATLDDAGDIIDNDLGAGQRVFTVGSAARVEFAGGCTWTRQ